MLPDLFNKAAVQLHAGKFFPGDMNGFGWMADKAMFDGGPDIDQYGGGIVLQHRPGLFGVEIFYHKGLPIGFLSNEAGFVSVANVPVTDTGVLLIIDQA